VQSMIDLAHRSETGQQYLRNHLLGVSQRSRMLAAKLGLEISGALIGLLHDLGKASSEFQDYLLSFDSSSGLEPQSDLRGKIDHSTAGAQCLIHNLTDGAREASLPGLVARILGLCIASHHSGLIDCLIPDGSDGLTTRLKKCDSKTRYQESWRRLDSEARAEAERLLHHTELLEEWNRTLYAIVKGPRTSGDRAVQLGLLVRLLFSCLIDADRTNTADFEKPPSAFLRQNLAYESWPVLLARLERGLQDFPNDGEVNRVRRAISSECFLAGARPRGIYTLTVPTGGGKTLAALRFALEHARRHALDRIIFVSPYISIVDQNAAVARAYLEPETVPYATVVLEHHSDLARERNGVQDRESWRRRVLAENWDAPVIFTTMVQVLESLFGSGTRSVRRMHAMAKAVIVFDEVQTLPVRLVHLFNNAINLLAAHCGSTVLLCTATQPLLEGVDPMHGAAQLSPMPELIGDVTALFRSLRRYTVFDASHRSGGWSHEEVATLACEEATAYGSCLVVVNTKRDALELFQVCRSQMPDHSLVVHLSTGMCPMHRTDVLTTLKSALWPENNSRPVLCISTQLIEAGVDIDFAVVVRDLAGLDSVAQAAGRCNRHGRRAQPGRVHIVKMLGLPNQLVDICKGREVAEEVLGLWRRSHPQEPFPLDDPEQMKVFYRDSFYRRQHEMRYPISAEVAGHETTLLDLLGSNYAAYEEMKRLRIPLERSILLQSFKTANEAFVSIEATQGIVVPYKESGRELVATLCASHDLATEWQLLRSAQPYTISVYESQFRQLKDKGAIYEASPGTGVHCLQAEFYDLAFGLRSEAGPLEELIA
jgi:CRISPR-associated endonuclease/helicase Cas3